ncbi:hypothetical protein I4U23_005575 [Adineta vaga]|nr:hypothetical protein I4U23_005575 [Adineta vaga]
MWMRRDKSEFHTHPKLIDIYLKSWNHIYPYLFKVNNSHRHKPCIELTNVNRLPNVQDLFYASKLQIDNTNLLQTSSLRFLRHLTATQSSINEIQGICSSAPLLQSLKINNLMLNTSHQLLLPAQQLTRLALYFNGEYSTPFWIHEKQWFVACTWKCLYSVPYFSDTCTDKVFRPPLYTTAPNFIKKYRSFNDFNFVKLIASSPTIIDYLSTFNEDFYTFVGLAQRFPNVEVLHVNSIQWKTRIAQLIDRLKNLSNASFLLVITKSILNQPNETESSMTKSIIAETRYLKNETFTCRCQSVPTNDQKQITDCYFWIDKQKRKSSQEKYCLSKLGDRYYRLGHFI